MNHPEYVEVTRHLLKMIESFFEIYKEDHYRDNFTDGIHEDVKKYLYPDRYPKSELHLNQTKFRH